MGKKLIGMNRLKVISRDFFYNILASLIVTGTSQIIVYPVLAYHFSSNEYGTILTIMGIINTIIVTFGNTLNNVRLIMANEYNEKRLVGDFNIIMLFSVFVIVLINIILSITIFDSTELESMGLCALAIIGALRSYFCVTFRLVLNFKKVLIQSIWGAVGFVFGLVLVFVCNYWIIPFVLSEIIQLIYIFFNSELQKEGVSTTILLKTTISKYIILIITGFSTTILTYMDRMILYPMLGASSVATYTVAAYFGKILGVLMGPIAGVLLGYYSQKGFSMSKKLFWRINIISLVIGAVFLVFVFVFAPSATKLLFPTIYEKASMYIIIANLAAIINVVCSMTQASVLKFAPTELQIVKELTYGVIYVLGGYFLLRMYGLQGFCMAAIFANTIKLLILYIIGTIYINDMQ